MGQETASGRAEKSAEGEQLEKQMGEVEVNAPEVGELQTTDGDEAQAEVAAEVADSAQKLDDGIQG